MTRVVITGIGAVTPLGNDADSTWQGLRAGRSGVGRLDRFDASTFDVRIAGQVKDFQPVAGLSRAAGFGMAAACEAIRDAGAGWWAVDRYHRGVSVGGTVGRPDLRELLDMSAAVADGHLPRQDPRAVSLREQNVAVAAFAEMAGCRGPVLSVSTACAGAAHAIGEAYRMIQDGDCQVMLAGGFDALTTWLDVLGFSLLRALTTEHNHEPERGSRPFDARRSGFVLGEGAVMVVLETEASAVGRKARIHGEIRGYGSTLNAYRITDAPPDGGGAVAAMRDAITESGMAPAEIGYIAAHGTGTPGNDVSETAAIKEVFGAHASEVAISSPKSMTGHLTSAAAGVNLLAALGALREQVVPPTINLDYPDPRLDLDYVPHTARPRRVRATLVNSFAFGGTNACLVVT